MSLLVPLGVKSLCNVWLYFKDDSLELEALGGGAGTCLGFPVRGGGNSEVLFQLDRFLTTTDLQPLKRPHIAQYFSLFQSVSLWSVAFFVVTGESTQVDRKS